MSAEKLISTIRPLASQNGLRINWRAFDHDEPLKQVLSYVSANPDKVLSLPEAAKLAGMGRSHFAAYFRKAVGVPYKHWFDFQRVSRSTVLLRLTNKSMLEVAEECGFGDATTFTRTFRRIEGVTPRDFRSGQQNGMKPVRLDESPKNSDESPKVLDESPRKRTRVRVVCPRFSRRSRSPNSKDLCR